MKEQLVVNCQDFNGVVGFRLFKPSSDRTKNLDITNIKAAYNSLGINLSHDNAMLLLKRYDNNRDGEFTYTDIVDMYKPRDLALGKEFERRLPFDHKRSDQSLSYETLTALRTLFNKTL
tara:strand:+ start:559 stop:915 length:357 start_codon:yes stop_codon:yes gene_type:complete